MMKDKYANYVVQKAVEVVGQPLREVLVNKIYNIPDQNCYSNFILIIAQHVFNAIAKLSSVKYQGQYYTSYMK